MPESYTFTLWPGLYEIDSPEPITKTWPEVLAFFSKHEQSRRKTTACWSPYVCTAPRTTCYKHADGIPRPGPHRCNSSINAGGYTLACFDVDQGSYAQCGDLARRLESAGILYCMYSTFSHDPEKDGMGRYRLIIPLDRPIHPAVWLQLRERLIRDLAIPADIKTSSGWSHAYFRPSCQPWRTPEFLSGGREPLRVNDYVIGNEASIVIPPLDLPLPEDGEVANEAEQARLVGALRAKATRCQRNPATQQKGEWLARALDGLALTEHGSRTIATVVTCGMMAYAAPEASIATLRELIRPSVDKMIAAGSKLTLERVSGMLASSKRNYQLEQSRKDEIRKWLDEQCPR